MPKKLCCKQIELKKPKWLKHRARAHAGIWPETYADQWPFNSLEAPENFATLTTSELSVAVKVLHQVEVVISSRTKVVVRGPLSTGFSVAAMSHAKKSFVDLLNRAGIVSSYQNVYEWRLREITHREAAGPFTTLSNGSFVCIGIDNINLQALNQLAVHGSTYLGFDGLAVQALNPCDSFNFEAYCALLPIECRLPVVIPLEDLRANRLQHMKECFASQQDEDIMGFRHLACGLAIANRNDISSEDNSVQKSFRGILMDGLKGYSSGEARV